MAEAADILYGTPEPVESTAPENAVGLEALYTNTVDSRARQIAEDAVDNGAILPGEVENTARVLTRELGSLRGSHDERGSLLNATSQPLPEGADLNRAVGAANRMLHDAFGTDAQRLVAEAGEWLKRVAPSIAQSVVTSRAGVDGATLVEIVRAYRRRNV